MTKPDPFLTPMIFLRIAWMDSYRGMGAGDKPRGGGKYVDEHGFGHEIFNFQAFDGQMYGFVQTKISDGEDADIKLERLGAAAGAESLPGVLAVWIATDPVAGGAYIVGWYDNATVFRGRQQPVEGSNRTHGGDNCGYYVRAKADDATLLVKSERVVRVQQRKKGWLGQNNIWYADDDTNEEIRQFRLGVTEYIKTGWNPATIPSGGKSGPRYQPDPLIRQQVEKIAVKKTWEHFGEKGLGYALKSVEKENLGWDLNAVLDDRTLRLEVKGLSGVDICVDLTPNEFMAMQKHQSSYQICVVSNALIDPRLEIFAYNEEFTRWESGEGRILNLQMIESLRCSVG